jgi:hypothetical protein
MKKAVTITATVAAVAIAGYFAYLNLCATSSCVDKFTNFVSVFSGNSYGDQAGTGTSTQKQTVNIYFIELQSQSSKGKPVGCGDRIIPVRKTVFAAPDGTLAVALKSLFGIKDRQVQIADGTTYYNALFQSSLKVNSATVKDGEATVYLSGKLVSNGVCDDPRIYSQINETVRQFSSVTVSKIFINNKPLEDVLSSK